MRPTNKARQRNKSGKPRHNGGNIINRVFDSSGPEGKVRGTPRQIIDKYQALAQDALLAGDRIAHESFLQFAEHYLRLLGAAQREMDERAENGRMAAEGAQGGKPKAANGGNGMPHNPSSDSAGGSSDSSNNSPNNSSSDSPSAPPSVSGAGRQPSVKRAPAPAPSQPSPSSAPSEEGGDHFPAFITEGSDLVATPEDND